MGPRAPASGPPHVVLFFADRRREPLEHARVALLALDRVDAEHEVQEALHGQDCDREVEPATGPVEAADCTPPLLHKHCCLVQHTEGVLETSSPRTGACPFNSLLLILIRLGRSVCFISRRSFGDPRWVIGGYPIFGRHPWVPAEN